jgi:hypothetical protein
MLKLILIAALFATRAFAACASGFIQITDPFLNPNSTPWRGSIVYTLAYNTTVAGATVVGARQQFNVTSGISICLAPGLYAPVILNQGGFSAPITNSWGVPVSGGPYTVAQIQGNITLQGTFGSVALSGTPLAGQVPTAISSAAAIWQTPAAGGLLQSNTVTVSSAQLLSNSPIVLVPAAGSGMVVFPVAIRIKLAFGTVAYAARDSGPYLWWGSNTGQFISFGTLDTTARPFDVLFASITSAFYVSGLSAWNSMNMNAGFPPSAYDNNPIVLQEEQTFTLNCGPVLTAVATVPGTGYLVGNQVQPGSPLGIGNGDAVLTVSSVNGGGGITGLTITDPGSANDAGLGNRTSNITGSGSGARITTTVQSGDSTLLVTTWYTVAPL